MVLVENHLRTILALQASSHLCPMPLAAVVVAALILDFDAIDGDGVDCGVVLMRELEAAYAAGDGRRISVAAQALKGVAGTAGAARLSAEANGFSSSPSSESITKLWEMLAEARAAFALFEADEVAGQPARS